MGRGVASSETGSRVEAGRLPGDREACCEARSAAPAPAERVAARLRRPRRRARRPGRGTCHRRRAGAFVRVDAAGELIEHLPQHRVPASARPSTGGIGGMFRGSRTGAARAALSAASASGSSRVASALSSRWPACRGQVRTADDCSGTAAARRRRTPRLAAQPGGASRTTPGSRPARGRKTASSSSSVGDTATKSCSARCRRWSGPLPAGGRPRTQRTAAPRLDRSADAGARR